MGAFKPSDQLNTMLNGLTTKQAQAVIYMAEQIELQHRSVESLLKSGDKVCSYKTYYEAGGWNDQAAFQDALRLARQEVRSARMSEAVNAALDRLKLAAPDAAADLHRQITGDHDAISGLADVLNGGKYNNEQRKAAARALGSIGTPAAVEVLLKALTTVRVEIRLDVIEALGSSASGIEPARRMASIAVLDRADVNTAEKGAGRSADALSDEELERIIHGSDAQRGGSGNSEPPVSASQP